MKLKQKKNRVLGFLMFTSSQIGFPRSNSRHSVSSARKILCVRVSSEVSSATVSLSTWLSFQILPHSFKSFFLRRAYLRVVWEKLPCIIFICKI